MNGQTPWEGIVVVHSSLVPAAALAPLLERDGRPEIAARGRTPLTLSEGICWLLAEPAQLEPNHCFMTIASRKPKARQPKLRADRILAISPEEVPLFGADISVAIMRMTS